MEDRFEEDNMLDGEIEKAAGMCERCRRICDDRRIAQLKREIQRDKERLEMIEALRNTLGRLGSALGSE